MAHWRRDLRSEHPTLRDGGAQRVCHLEGLGSESCLGQMAPC